MVKQLGVATLAAIAVTAAANLSFKHYVDPYETVFRIVDGDTFILQTNKQAVRLFGIDAPDLTLCYGPQAQSRLSELLKKSKVQLKEPVVDHFGRIVALVFVDGKLVNEMLIREGFAAYRSEPGSGKEIMLAAHNEAKTKHLGIYSPLCSSETPPDPKCAIKGNHDLDREEYLYLTPDCPYYSATNVRLFEGDSWFCTEKDAKKAGFTRSSACDLGISRTK